MSVAFLCLDPLGAWQTYTADNYDPFSDKDHSFLTEIIEKYKNMYFLASRLADLGWKTKVCGGGDENHYCIINPPTEVETEEEVQNLLDKEGIDITGLGWIEVEEDFDPDAQIYGDISIDDYDDIDYEEFKEFCHEEEEGDFHDCPLLAPEMAEELVGARITGVCTIQDFQVVLHLDDGRELVYDEELGFYLRLPE